MQGPDPKGLPGFADGASLAAGLNPFGERARVDNYPQLGIEGLAMEFMPRITRAQWLDFLSSQPNLAGSNTVMRAATAYGRTFRMLWTAPTTAAAATQL